MLISRFKFLSFLFLLSFLLLVSCSTKNNKNSTIGESIQKSDTLKNQYAKAFRIIYHNKNAQIDILNPENGSILQTYTIGNSNSNKSNHFSKNLHRIVTFSTTEIGFLRKLDLQDNVVGISNYKYLCHPLNRTKTKEVGEIGQSNPETVMLTHPDIVFYSGFDLHAPILLKFKEAGIKTFLSYEWKETTPLGRAEWIKVYGILFNCEQKANAIFSKIKQKYLEVKEKLKLAKNNPTVISGTYYNDVFNAPAGNSYMAKLILDANAHYVYANSKGTGSLSLPIENVILKNRSTQYWLNVSASSKYEILKQSDHFKLWEVFKNGNIFTYFDNKNCFWANSAVAPDVVLKDLGKILHPELFPHYQLVYYKKVE